MSPWNLGEVWLGHEHRLSLNVFELAYGSMGFPWEVVYFDYDAFLDSQNKPTSVGNSINTNNHKKLAYSVS